jgi:hypothetical protein
MDMILNQITGALAAGLHYLAVTAALTLPDICAALESHDGETSKSKYLAWYERWLARKYPMVSGHDMYRLRCGVVHQGILGPNGMQYDRIVFVINVPMHCCVSAGNGGSSESALQLNVSQFCRDVVESVHEWYAAKHDDAVVAKNLPRLLQFRPNGLHPHFWGIPLIA